MMFCKKKVKENVANFFNKKKKALFIQVDCEEFVSNVKINFFLKSIKLELIN